MLQHAVAVRLLERFTRWAQSHLDLILADIRRGCHSLDEAVAYQLRYMQVSSAAQYIVENAPPSAGSRRCC
jgi:hypothetical protein